MRRSLAPLALALLLVPASRAQQPAKSPLVISNVSQQGATVSFDLTNVSAKPIRADVIACAMKDPNGQPGAVTVQQTAIYGLGAEVLVPPAFDAGLTHHEQFNAARNARGHCALSVDYVLFTDGSGWGSDTGKSQSIRAVISGYNTAVMNLQNKLKQRGANAVLEYIREFQPGANSGYNTALVRLRSRLKQGGTDSVLEYIREFKPIQ
jgi:hypothetical protein